MADNKKVRSFTRVDDTLWDRALNKARSEGTTVSEVVRDLLADYVEDQPVTDELRRVIKWLNEIRQRPELLGDTIWIRMAVAILEELYAAQL